MNVKFVFVVLVCVAAVLVNAEDAKKSKPDTLKTSQSVNEYHLNQEYQKTAQDNRDYEPDKGNYGHLSYRSVGDHQVNQADHQNGNAPAPAADEYDYQANQHGGNKDQQPPADNWGVKGGRAAVVESPPSADQVTEQHHGQAAVPDHNNQQIVSTYETNYQTDGNDHHGAKSPPRVTTYYGGFKPIISHQTQLNQLNGNVEQLRFVEPRQPVHQVVYQNHQVQLQQQQQHHQPEHHQQQQPDHHQQQQQQQQQQPEHHQQLQHQNQQLQYQVYEQVLPNHQVQGGGGGSYVQPQYEIQYVPEYLPQPQQQQQQQQHDQQQQINQQNQLSDHHQNQAIDQTQTIDQQNGHLQNTAQIQYQTNIGHHNPNGQIIKQQEYPIAVNLVQYTGAQPNYDTYNVANDYGSGANVAQLATGTGKGYEQLVLNTATVGGGNAGNTGTVVIGGGGDVSEYSTSGKTYQTYTQPAYQTVGTGKLAYTPGLEKNLETFYNQEIRKIISMYQKPGYGKSVNTGYQQVATSAKLPTYHDDTATSVLGVGGTKGSKLSSLYSNAELLSSIPSTSYAQTYTGDTSGGSFPLSEYMSSSWAKDYPTTSVGSLTGYGNTLKGYTYGLLDGARHGLKSMFYGTPLKYTSPKYLAMAASSILPTYTQQYPLYYNKLVSQLLPKPASFAANPAPSSSSNKFTQVIRHPFKTIHNALFGNRVNG